MSLYNQNRETKYDISLIPTVKEWIYPPKHSHAKVDLGRFELPTSSLQMRRSDQLSHRPERYNLERSEIPIGETKPQAPIFLKVLLSIKKKTESLSLSVSFKKYPKTTLLERYFGIDYSLVFEDRSKAY